MDMVLALIAFVLSATPDDVRFFLMDAGLLEGVEALADFAGWIFFEDGTLSAPKE